MTQYILYLLSVSERELISWANNVVNHQYYLAANGIAIIFFLAILIAGATWFTNYRLIQHELNLKKREIENIIESLKQDIIKSTYEKTTNLEKSNLRFRESIQQALLLFNADKARLFALVSQQAELYSKAAMWWAKSIGDYVKAKRHKMIRIAVSCLAVNLEQCKELDQESYNDIETNIVFIPLILNKEKRNIEELLKKKKIQD